MGQDKGGNLGGKAKRKRHDKKKASSTAHASEQVRAAKSQTNALFNLATTSNPNPKHLGPFSDRQRILVIGDGDLSFSLSLAVFLGGRNIVATCYDSKREVKEKYTNSLLNADALETAGAQVHFDVDGTALEKEAWLLNEEKFQTIVFNFPHLGGATEDDVVKNQELLRNFFYSTRPFLHPTRGQVLVSLRNTLFYNRWKIQEQAKVSGFKPMRVEPFDGSMYSGYEPQRTHPASFRGEPPSTTGAHYYIFTKDNSVQLEDPRVTSGDGDGTEDAKPKRKLAVDQHDTKSKKAKLEKPSSAESLECKVCATKFRDVKKFNAHMNSAKHARKVKAQKKR